MSDAVFKPWSLPRMLALGFGVGFVMQCLMVGLGPDLVVPPGSDAASYAGRIIGRIAGGALAVGLLFMVAAAVRNLWLKPKG